MNEEGVIKKVIGNKALVLLQRSTMCDSCGNRGMCKPLGSGRNMEVEVFNTAGGTEGDRVQITIKSSSLLKITFLVYIVPLMGLVLGAFIGFYAAPHYSMNTEICSLLSGLFLFVVAFIIITRISKIMGSKRKYLPEITKVIKCAT